MYPMINILKWLLPNALFAWLAVALLWCLAKLPKSFAIRLGKALGLLAYYIDARHRRIALINIQKCFKELTAIQQKKFVQEVFAEFGCAVVEASWSFFDHRKNWCDEQIKVIGQEDLLKVLNENKPVILIGSHFTAIEMLPFLNQWIVGQQYHKKIVPVVRFHPNPVFQKLLNRRLRYVKSLVSSRDTRAFLREVLNKNILWLAADQDVGRKGSIFAPFFGQMASTITSPRMLAKHTQAEVFQIIIQRNERWLNANAPCYTCTLIQMNQDQPYPSDDELADITYQNAVLEKLIRQAPTQYFWLHRRFKTQPDGTNPYKVS